MRRCFLCGRNGTQDPLDRHHCFGGALRDKSERYGLVVDLCHDRCHIFGADAVHRNPAARETVQKWAQKKAMEDNDWTVEQFRWEFGRNVLDEADLIPASVPDYGMGGFMILED